MAKTRVAIVDIDLDLFEVVTKNMAMVLVAYSTKMHHSCLMENAGNNTQETYLLRLSLAMTDIHSIVDNQLKMAANPCL